MSDALTARLTPNFTLPNPVLAASGTFGYGEEIADLADCGTLGALITPTVTREPRLGHAPPRTAEAAAGLLHALGLPNPGLSAFLAERLPRLSALPCPIIVSVYGETAAEWKVLAEDLSGKGGMAALEMNLTFPALEEGRDGHVSYPTEAELLVWIAESVSEVRAATSLPVIAKLPGIGVEIGAAAQAAANAGADMIAVSQAFPGVAVRLSERRFRFPGVVGQLSGPCIKPLALYQVWRVARSVPLPILGSGGIMTAEDALEFLVAGASAVAVGVANNISPTVIARITTDLTAYLARHEFNSVRDIVGAALHG
jgi:dihydroorotate dehydrogenase (NAD+) catalytic subunit